MTSNYIGKYKQISLLGYGSFGNVFEVTRGKKTYALKRIVDINECALKEAKILDMVRHNYIVQQHETFLFNDYLCIVMEYADRGTLTSFVAEMWDKGIGAEYNVWRVLDNLSDALGYLHTFQPTPIIHCDLKPGNVLVFTGDSAMETGTKIHLKIADFGVAKLLNEKDQMRLYTNSFTQCGTVIYMAPEVLNGRPFTFSADQWSLGAIMSFYCNAGSHLFTKIKHVFKWNGCKCPIPSYYSESLKTIIMSLMSPDPRSRPSATKVNLRCTKSRTERGRHNEDDN